MRSLALAAIGFWLAQAVPVRDRAPAPAAVTATLTGRVVDDRGSPVPAAHVVAAGGPAVPGARSAITTEEGRYAIRDLDPGLYTISMSGNGYPSVSYGQTRIGGPGKVIDIKPRQDLVLPLVLPRGGVIAGTVLDELGNPVKGGVQVRRESAPGTRQPFAPHMTVDSRGRFRAFGLAAGTYVVSSSRVAGDSDPSAAITLTIAAGEERDGVVVRMQPPAPRTYVTVSATASDGRPVPSFQLTLRKPGEVRPIYSSNRPNPDGSRTLTDITAGQYRVVARNGPYIGAAEVRVDGEHPASVTITMTRGISVRGTVKTDEGVPGPSRFSVLLAPADADGMLDDNNGAMGQVAADGTFTVPGVPAGRYFLRTFLNDRDSWALSSAIAGTIDIADEPLTVGRDDVSGITVTLTKQKTRLSGIVNDATGAPANGVDVVAFPADERYRVRDSRRVVVSRTTIAGEYDIRGLPPGRYALAIADDVDQQAVRDPNVVNRLKPVSAVTLAAGDARTLNLTMR
jgi:hypothetical protein